MITDNRDERTAGPGTAKQNERESISRARKMLIVLLLLSLAITAVWTWKEVQMNYLRKQANHDQQQVQAIAMQAVVQSHREHLKLLAMPYVWAIRAELLRGNINQVNTYANEMIRQKNFQQIIVCNDKGTIISATNKKLEGKDCSTVGKQAYLSVDTTTVENVNDSVLTVYSPIMGFNNRLGTLVMTYKVAKPAFKKYTEKE